MKKNRGLIKLNQDGITIKRWLEEIVGPAFTYVKHSKNKRLYVFSCNGALINFYSRDDGYITVHWALGKNESRSEEIAKKLEKKEKEEIERKRDLFFS